MRAFNSFFSRCLLPLACFFCMQELVAQVNVSIRIVPPYLTRITDYASRPELALITITNTSSDAKRIQLRGSVTGENGIVMRVKERYRSTTPLEMSPLQTVVLNGADLAFLFDYNQLDFTNMTSSQFIRDNGLPEGNYSLCVRAYDYDSNEPLSADEPLGCAMFRISNAEPPTILAPFNEQEVESKGVQAMVLRWSTPPGANLSSLEYKVRLVEIIANRNPNDALLSATQPPFFETTVQGNMMIYGPEAPQLTPGRQYAMVVQAVDPRQTVNFRNRGLSEVVSFTYGKEQDPLIPTGPMTVRTQPVTVFTGAVPDCDCKVDVGNGLPKNEDVQLNEEIDVGSFKMRIASLERGEDGKLQGTGTIALPFIGAAPGARLRVQFSDLNVNEQKRMISGTVEGMVAAAAASLIPVADNPESPTLSIGQQEAANIGAYFDQHAEQLLSSVKNSANTLGFELPLGLDSGPILVAIAHVYFNAEQAWMEVVSSVDIPDGHTTIALSGRGICLKATDMCHTGTLFLSEDVRLPFGLTLKKPGGNTAEEPGTYISFNKDGFEELFIDATYTFPANSLVNESDGTPAVARLTANTTEGWSDWIAQVTIEPFTISGLADFKFSLGNLPENKRMLYDHSDLKNGAGMPARIEGGDDEFIDTSLPVWRGFFIPELAVELPSVIKGTNNNPIKIKASNLIFDDGLSGTFGVTDILKLQDGSLGGWFFSVDQLGITFFKNSLKKGSMTGRLMLPASGDKTNVASNQLDYSCNLTVPSGSVAFNFSVTPKDRLGFSALWANVNIDGGSEIRIDAGSGGFKATARLNGSMTVDTDIEGLPDLTLGYMRFQDMTFATEGTLFSPGQFEAGIGAPPSTASLYEEGTRMELANARGGPAVPETFLYQREGAGNGQQNLMGFHFEVDAIEPFAQDNKVGLSIFSKMQLVNGVNFIPKAQLGFCFYAKTDAATGGRKWWKAIGGEVNAVELEVNADLAGMKLEGMIRYFNMPGGEGGAIDRGFAGGLMVTLPGFATNFAMKGLFGSRKGGNSAPFQFFYVDALFDLGNTGIPMFPGTALYGFAGGAYYNMEKVGSTVYSKANDKMPDIKDANQFARIQSFSGVEYRPKNDNGSTFGFSAGIYFGLQARPIFDAELVLSMGFSNGNLNRIALDGRGNFMNNGAPTFNDRYEKAMAKAQVKVEVQFKNGDFHIFEMGVPDFSLKYPPANPVFTANGAMIFHIEKAGDGTKWYFKAGRPWNQGQPIAATFDARVFKIGATTYFQTGNYNIDEIPPVPPFIEAILNKGRREASTEENSRMNNDTETLTYAENGNERANLSESGLITGAMVEFEAHPKFAIFYADLKAGLGADLSLKFYDKTKGQAACAISDASWYATGQAFVGAEAGCGVRVSVFGIKKDIEFVRAGLAASVKAGAPDPLYAQGVLGGYFSVLGGLVSGDFKVKFTVGTVCDNTPSSDKLELIASLFPNEGENAEHNVFTRPAVSFNFPINNDFIVPITDPESHETSYTLFRFSKKDVTVNLVGGNQRFGIGQMAYPNGKKDLLGARGYGTNIYTLQLSNDQDSPSLLPQTSFNYEVRAKVQKYILSFFSTKEALQGQKDRASDNFFTYVMDGNKVYEHVKSTTFKTDKGPKSIPVSNVEELLPYHRLQGMPRDAIRILQGNDGYGYIQLKVGMNGTESFDTPYKGAPIKIRFVLAEGGNLQVNDYPVELVEGGKRWRFRMPTLLPANIYALKVYFDGKGQIPASNGQPNATTILAAREQYLRQTFAVNDRALIEHALRMKAGEQELFAWYFKTGVTDSYQQKYNALKLTKLLVGNAEASLSNSKEINLQHFDWANDEAKKTVSALGVSYFFVSPEAFNVLDVTDKFRNDVLPVSAQIGADLRWKGMLERSGLYPYENYISELDFMVKTFSEVAFGPGKQLEISIPTLPWNPLTGGISKRSSVEYLHTSGLMAKNMFGIDFSGNTYSEETPAVQTGTSASSSQHGQTAPSGISNSPATQLLTQINSRQLIQRSFSSSLMGNPDLKLSITVSHQSGKGLLEAGNSMFQRVLQQKKDLGYPADPFSSLSGFGKAMDAVGQVAGQSISTFGPPAGLNAPKLQVVAPKMIR